HRLLDGDLHLGQRGDRNPWGQFLVEDMVLAHVTVRQDIIAELLRRSQAGTMPEHEPGVRAQHGDVVGDGAGIRWAGADVYHSNALKTGLYEMEGRHLRHALDSGARRSSAQARIARNHIAGLD